MSDPPPPPSATATESPWARPGLSWRSAWPSIILVLAAFQAGVISTLVVVWGRLDEPRSAPQTTTSPPPTRPPTIAPAASPLTVEQPPTQVPVPSPSPSPSPSPPQRPARPARSERAPAALVEVEITSEPEGATVRIEGAVWGITPLTAFLPGNQSTWIDLELAGDVTRTRWNPGSGVRTLRVDLHPMEHP